MKSVQKKTPNQQKHFVRQYFELVGQIKMALISADTTTFKKCLAMINGYGCCQYLPGNWDTNNIIHILRQYFFFSVLACILYLRFIEFWVIPWNECAWAYTRARLQMSVYVCVRNAYGWVYNGFTMHHHQYRNGYVVLITNAWAECADYNRKTN